MAKIRLDDLLIQHAHAEDKRAAEILIRTGKVRIDGHPQTKPGHTFAEDSELTVIADARFVSRGGEKLQGALDQFPIEVEGRVCLDIGSSTGGFTDALLQAGAKKVYAVDAGTNQLVWKLRDDPRVVVMEKTNARYLTPEDIAEPAQLCVVDVSFISLTKILPAVMPLLQPFEGLVTLIKPQFEARRDQVGKNGVVRDNSVHEEVKQNILTFGTETLGLHCNAIIDSPLRGPAGNIEFLAYWTRL